MANLSCSEYRCSVGMPLPVVMEIIYTIWYGYRRVEVTNCGLYTTRLNNIYVAIMTFS